MRPLTQAILTLHEATSSPVFLGVCALLSVLLCFVAIPWTSGLMVNNAAGLATRWFGRSSRALVINASTNNPEAFSMGVAMGMGRMGGWANPLGSLLANCYLLYAIGLVYVMLKFLVLGKRSELKRFLRLLRRERKLVTWHLTMALGLFAVGTLVLRIMGFGGGGRGGGEGNEGASTLEASPRVGWWLAASIGILVLSLGVAFLAEGRLKRRRPELFTDIHDLHHRESIVAFLLGTLGLVAACWVMNALFEAFSLLYGDVLESWIGLAAFGALHYFLGALITSLPELKVATENYARITAPDLNTALGSASYSNLVNIMIALVGLLVFGVLHLSGTTLSW